MQEQYDREKWLATDEALIAVNDGEDEARCLGLRLIRVIQHGDPRRANLLIAGGADLNVQDQEGMTPMHHAVAYGARSCIRLLIATQKCDCTIFDKEYRYASDLAVESARDYAVARLLGKHQCRQAFERGIPAVVFPPEGEQWKRQRTPF